MYHNTNHESGAVLECSQAKAKTQESRILDHFRKGGEYTPDQVWHKLFRNGTPLTSVRRAITNLTADGYLEKTERQQPGMYGKMTYTWRLVRTPGYQARLFITF